MDLPSLAAFHTVEFLGFYLPPLPLWAAAALIPFVMLRWLLDRSGFAGPFRQSLCVLPVHLPT